jgi:hypothetical protein
MAFTKIPKDTLMYWLVRILLVLLPAAAAAFGAIQVAKIEAATAKVQAEAGYKTSSERIKELEEIQDALVLKVAKHEGELEILVRGLQKEAAEGPNKDELAKALYGEFLTAAAKAPPKPARFPRGPMPKTLEKAVEFQRAK